jgi:hypothetical protein
MQIRAGYEISYDCRSQPRSAHASLQASRSSPMKSLRPALRRPKRHACNVTPKSVRTQDADPVHAHLDRRLPLSALPRPPLCPLLCRYRAQNGQDISDLACLRSAEPEPPRCNVMLANGTYLPSHSASPITCTESINCSLDRLASASPAARDTKCCCDRRIGKTSWFL